MICALSEKSSGSPERPERRVGERRQFNRRRGERFAHEGWLFGGGTIRRSGVERRSNNDRRKGWDRAKPNFSTD